MRCTDPVIEAVRRSIEVAWAPGIQQVLCIDAQGFRGGRGRLNASANLGSIKLQKCSKEVLFNLYKKIGQFVHLW
jgi:hypothetical protein